MKRVLGRNIYVVSLVNVIANSGGISNFVARCRNSHFSSIWIRLGYGSQRDPNLAYDGFSATRDELRSVGIQTWGWHVPRCKTTSAADDEARRVAAWVTSCELDGVLIDAEFGSKYFLGGESEAEVYAEQLHRELILKERGVALSSHDQPHYFPEFPFESFLDYVQDNCPQVYYSSESVFGRLAQSIHDYQQLEQGKNFIDRYKPVGNITVHGDVALPSTKICLRKAKQFIDQVTTNGFHGYSFWCWDEAPEEIWDFFRTSPLPHGRTSPRSAQRQVGARRRA